jgi:hypothetical protein
MSKEVFVVALATGAGLLAMWIHVRFPRLAPARMGQTMLHAGAAFVLLLLTPGLSGSVPAKFGLVFLFVLPALVYALLCTLWMLKHAQTALGVSR